MPIYEYACLNCKGRFQVMQKFSDIPLTSCQECGGTLQRIISAPAIHFKGTGWYVTDYARKGGNNGQKSKQESQSKDQKKSSNTEISSKA